MSREVQLGGKQAEQKEVKGPEQGFRSEGVKTNISQEKDTEGL